jgi:hypothetical protein
VRWVDTEDPKPTHSFVNAHIEPTSNWYGWLHATLNIVYWKSWTQIYWNYPMDHLFGPFWRVMTTEYRLQHLLLLSLSRIWAVSTCLHKFYSTLIFLKHCFSSTVPSTASWRTTRPDVPQLVTSWSG